MGPPQLRQRPLRPCLAGLPLPCSRGMSAWGPRVSLHLGCGRLAQTGSLQGDKVGAGDSRHLLPLSRSLCSHVCEHLKLLGVLSDER